VHFAITKLGSMGQVMVASWDGTRERTRRRTERSSLSCARKLRGRERDSAPSVFAGQLPQNTPSIQSHGSRWLACEAACGRRHAPQDLEKSPL
jgi:hypothetical protein